MLTFDLETEPFAPLDAAPRPVLAQVSGDLTPIDREGAYVRGDALMARPGSPAYRSIFDHVFEHGFIGQNAPFDICVSIEHERQVEAAFVLLDRGLVHSVDTRERILNIAQDQYVKGTLYNLGAIGAKYGAIVDKANPWRVRYAELEDVPWEKWPESAIEYALGDVGAPRIAYDGQEVRRARVVQDTGHDPFADEARATRASFALALISAHGIVPDREALEYYRTWVEKRIRTARRVLLRAGFLRLDKNTGVYTKRAKLMRERVVAAWGGRFETLRDWLNENRETADDFRARAELDAYSIDLILDQPGQLDAYRAKVVSDATRGEFAPYPRTPTGLPALDAATAEALDIPELRAWLEYSSAQSARDRYSEVAGTLCQPCRWVKKKPGSVVGTCGACGASVPAIHTRFTLAASGRARSSSPNTQNRPRGGPDREAFAPNTGAYLITDHDQLELSTVAQALVTLGCGHKLADALNSGIDGHLVVAAELLGITYDEAIARRKNHDVKHARQLAKVANFGFPGGLGAPTFCAWVLQFDPDLRLTIDEARALKRTWLKAWPEFRKYFRLVGGLTKTGRATIVQLFSGRVRGGVGFTDGCNTFFQGLGADVTHDVMFELQRACYIPPDPRVVADVLDLVHDGATDTWAIARKTGHAIEGVCNALLYGARIENYIHDEYLLAVGYRPERINGVLIDPTLTARARAKETIVTGVASRWLPDMKPTATATAARRWSKSAREIRDEHGRLVLWEVCDEIDDAVAALGTPERARTTYGRAVAERAGENPPAGLDARLSSAVLGYRRAPALETALDIVDKALDKARTSALG